MADYTTGDLIENRYRVLSIAGAGRMGKVYEAADETQGGRVVALKALPLDLPAADVRSAAERFKYEFKVLAQLQHPNLVSVYEYGALSSGGLYYTREFIRGDKLLDYVAQYGAAAATPLIVQVCRALAYLHARGIAHNDITPDNLVVLGETLKIVDFGVSLESGAAPANSEAAYAAPEVRAGQTPDPRADLYSLGAVWYHLLVGAPPRAEVDPAEQGALLEQALQAAAQAPTALRLVIARLLANSPEDRYPSAEAVINALNQASKTSYALETRETAASYALKAHFVGRGAALDVLKASWNLIRLSSSLVIIEGESGVGKTRLVEEFTLQAQLEGARLLRGQSLQGDGAYQSWQEILRPLVRYMEPADLALIQRVGPVLAAILPEIKSRPALAGLPAPTQLDPKGEQLRLQQAIFQLLRGAAALRPTVVVFENAHWADEASLDLLAFLTRTPSIPGLMICVTYRGEEVPTKHLLETITGNQIRRMHLKRLSPEATKQLAASMLGLKELPRALADRVQQATGGNPFFIQELIRSLAEDSTLLQRTPGGWQINERALVRAALPSSIQQTLAHRIERLPHHEREMLCWAATLGPIFWDGALARLGNLTREQVQEPLVALTAKELIAPRQSTAIPGEREYAFRHADLCGMVCDLLPNPQRAHLHAQAANWLIERTADRQDDFSGQIGEHLAAAGQPEAAITYLRRVGELAAARFANESALIWYQRALALFDHLGHSSAPAYLPQHLETHAAISDVLILLGRYEEALEQLEAARKLLEGKTLTLDRLRFFADLCRTTAQVYEKRSEYSLAQEWVDRGLRYLNLQPETVELARLYNLSGWLHMRQGDYAGALVELEKAFSAAQAANAPAEATNTLTVQGAVANRQGRYPDAQAYLERALAAARAANDKRAEASAQNTLGLVYFNRGDFVRSAECQEQAIALRRAIGDRQGEVSPLGNLASTHWARGDYAKARQAYDTELRLAHEIGDRWAEGAALNNLGTLYTELGSYQEANGCFEQAIPIKRAIGDREGESVLLSNLCWLHHLLNDNQAAYEYGVKALTQARTSGYRRHEAYCLIYLGHALGGLKRWPEAESAYQQSADLRAELGQTNLRIEALAGVVRAALAQGETARAVQVTEELLTHIKEHALDGADEPLRIYYTCYQALRQANDPRARSAIETAYAQLQARANKIGDEATRQAFLQNVAVNRAIVQEAGADRWKEG